MKWKLITRRLVVTGLFSLGALSIGCADSRDMPTVPVSGRVTFDGGPPPALGSITFMPRSGSSPAGLPAKPGSAQFDAEGRFWATSFKERDGLLPGTYGVSISCVKDYQNLNVNPDAVAVQDYVPQDYRPSDLVVKEGSEPIEVTFDVPPKKGKTQ